jgi:hypothetical protein
MVLSVQHVQVPDPPLPGAPRSEANWRMVSLNCERIHLQQFPPYKFIPPCLPAHQGLPRP